MFVSFSWFFLASSQLLGQGQASSFEQLQLLVKPGDNIYIGDFGGNTSKGKIVKLNRSTLSVTVNGLKRDLPQSDVLGSFGFNLSSRIYKREGWFRSRFDAAITPGPIPAVGN
jgi:hypothetical protein